MSTFFDNEMDVRGSIHMKNKKAYVIVLYTILALAINLCGRAMADHLMLPIWCDAIGTCLIAYVAGPVCGAMIGFSTNIIYGIFVEQQSVYCIVGALLGFVIGCFAKKRVFETQFTTMTFGMGLAIFSTILSTILNTVLYEGMSGNVWGNQVMKLCLDNGFPNYISYVLGQFSVEFMDKLLCVEIVYLLIRVVRKKREWGEKRKKQLGAWILPLLVVSILANKQLVMAKEEFTDYNSYIQIEYSNEDGLLSGEANDIKQTKDGKIWIGTYAGLFKYDGTKFTLMQNVESVKNVNCMYVDEEGRLWVGTNDDGVTIFINEHVMNVIDQDSGLLSNSVKSIVCDAKGNYYIGTTEGISVVSLSGGVRVTESVTQVKNIVNMSADRYGNVVVVTDRGAVFWLKDGKIVNPPLDIPDGCFFSMAYFTDDNRLLLGSSHNDVFVYDVKEEQFRLSKKIAVKGIEWINSFYVSEKNEIFVCADNGVAVLYPDGSYRKLNFKNFTSSIDNMLIDYQGNLWFSSSRLGLLEMCQSPFLELFSEINENAVVNTVEKWNDLLFCGTDNGLIIIDEKQKTKVENELCTLFVDTRVRCLMVDQKNHLWIATTGLGVFRVSVNSLGAYNIKNFTEADGLPGMRFRCVYELSDGKIAVAGDYGIAILSGNSVRKVYTLKQGLLNEKSLCLVEYHDALYVGSDGGGITKIQKDNKVENISKKDGLSSNIILRMVYEPVSDGMFIITSNGLCYMSKQGEITVLNSFPYSNNYDMVCETDGTCWILSSAGIYIAQSKELIENKKNDYLLVNTKRGFRSSLVANSWICKDEEELYLCCDEGVVKVNMSKYDMSAKSYRMVLNEVEVDGVKYEINRVDPFVLTSEMEKIVLAPEVLNYSMNDPYVSFMLEGYDNNETVCLLSELDKITYAKLKPGTYVFRFSILDGLDGNVVETGSYTIEKEIEMYQNWWFKIYVFVVAGLVVIWITWFVTRTQTQRTLLKQKYELEYAKKQIEMGNETILSIARTVDAKDSNTSEHSFRVSEYSVAIATSLGFSEEKRENLRQMALLHDIGKIGIPDAILNKPAKLTDEEYEMMKTHVIRGGDILKDFTMIDNVSVGALYHHERYDGKGYCSGLKGEEIPLEARIIGIADAFDAMTANRVYRKQLDIDYVIQELQRCKGTQFDPKLVDIMLALIEDGTINVEALYSKSKEGR